ncbi:MAG: LON peptidase substrate-binding domain-containing protein [Gemmatimonadetes bacterium]|nr:LON peptidase substrate-binding domain-containing protein [Gemmatimonadota bacterium]
MMSDIELPIFPLPLVLFPGVRQPLHVFEPRYRDLLRDCLAGDRRFGLSLLIPTPGTAGVPQPGDVGCTARIQSHHPLPDGRSNLLTVGENRYVLQRLVERDCAYLVGRVQFLHDETAEAEFAGITRRVREQFSRIISSFDDTGGMPGVSVHPPEDPEGLSFAVSAALDLGLATKAQLLRLTSTATRLERLHTLLQPLVRDAAKRTTVRKAAKRNGRRHAPTCSGE